MTQAESKWPTLTVEPGADGARLDVFLRDRLGALGRAGLRRLIEGGAVQIDGRRARSAGARLRSGQEVRVQAPVEPAAVPEPDAPLHVVYEDAQLVVVDKPAGMPSHPLRPGERGTLASALLARYPEMAGLGHGPREPGLVHRLDTDTSGLVIAARTREAFTALYAQLEQGAIDKRYLALCAGVPSAPAVHEAQLLARGKRVTVRVDAEASVQPHARAITTEVLRATPHGPLSLVELRVHRAGRHQVRAHLAALGHPIAGDALYGGPAVPGLMHHFLHASELGFVHPSSGVTIALRAELPEDLRAALRAAASLPAAP